MAVKGHREKERDPAALTAFQDRLATHMKLEEGLVKRLAQSTKLASGVWPPPDAAKNMVWRVAPGHGGVPQPGRGDATASNGSLLSVRGAGA